MNNCVVRVFGPAVANVTDPGGELFQYTMTWHGAFAGMTGSGTFNLSLTQSSPGHGRFTMVFHPYGWSTPQQIADLVDYADRTYGKRVKFLTFAEALERLNKNLLGSTGRGE